MTPNQRAQLQTIIDRHNDIARALDRSASMHDTAQDSLEASGRSLRDATHAIREAAEAMIAANVALVALLTEQETE